MTCAWQEFLAVLPAWMRRDVDAIGKETLQELRIRINSPPELIVPEQSLWLKRRFSQEDLQYIINAASQYSPWAAATTAKGYITIPGGHRIGLCGEMVVQQGTIKGFKKISALCIRIAKDFPGIAEEISTLPGSILILGPPGWGKTTLLRDLVRKLQNAEKICVVDERGELFPETLTGRNRLDILSGCSKSAGIPMVIRTMGPSCIAVDEITEPEDTAALQHAANCGVRLLATAHAASVSDFQSRCVYRPLVESRIFDMIVVLRKDRSYTTERVGQWSTNGSVLY